MGEIWVLLPTFNERDNVEPLARAVVDELDALGSDYRVLVIDDSSPDGTGQIADALSAELEQVQVIHRARKDGLGRAYLAGFTRALEAGAELVVLMDCDFSHDPSALPHLVQAADVCDVVVGSRYVPGGSVVDWGGRRRLLSRLGSLYARLVLGVGVRDLTGGFKCLRREVLEHLDLTAIQVDGYGFQVEITYRALQSGFRVREVPITFGARRAGKSKMNARIALEAAWKVPTLRARSQGLAPGVVAGARGTGR